MTSLYMAHNTTDYFHRSILPFAITLQLFHLPSSCKNTYYFFLPDFLPYISKTMFGNFSIQLDLPSLNTISFMGVLQISYLHQHVSFPTPGHWLDLFITRSTFINTKAIFPTDGLSDHLCVIIDLWLQALQTNFCNHMMSKAKSLYYANIISNNSENPRQMRKSVNTILHRQKLKALPEHS